MADKIQFPSAIHTIRMINDNIVSNLLVRRVAFIQEASSYNRAYALVHETGERPITENIVAPDEAQSNQSEINIVSGEG